MKMILKHLKPRNPLVAPALMRRAGGHRLRGGASRQRAGRTLQRELDQMKQHSP